VSNQGFNRFRELRMVEKRHGGIGEWTREGEQKGSILRAEYVRRRWLFVNKSRYMIVYNEWTFYVKPGGTAGVLLLSLQRNAVARDFFLPNKKGHMTDIEGERKCQNKFRTKSI